MQPVSKQATSTDKQLHSVDVTSAECRGIYITKNCTDEIALVLDYNKMYFIDIS